jgi:hypothetical protein
MKVGRFKSYPKMVTEGIFHSGKKAKVLEIKRDDTIIFYMMFRCIFSCSIVFVVAIAILVENEVTINLYINLEIKFNHYALIQCIVNFRFKDHF